jgi:4-hydroxy-tetrahydrodipicolinate synthase
MGASEDDMSESALADGQAPRVSNEPLNAQGYAHGIWAPALTPLNERLEPDTQKAIAYYRWLLESGCHGLAFMGTNSEATSFSVAERIALLEAALAAGIEPRRLMVGSGCAALSDSVTLTKHATEAGCSVLTLPPFYYKDIGEDGLYASYAELIERVASPDLRLYFYHFPKLSMVPIVPAVIERLLAAYPGVIKGLKDSSGDAAGCADYIERFAELAIFPGNELLLLDMLKLGGAGTITAGANVFAGAIRAVYDAYRTGEEAEATQLFERVAAVRRTIQSHPMIPALKATVATAWSDPAWRRVRPPLVPLDDQAAAAVASDLEQAGFTFGG